MDTTTPQEGQTKPIPESSAQAREAYAKAKQELIEALSRKRALDKQLMQCEIQIYNFEATYLTETATAGGGNIIHGFDGYLKSQGMNKRRTELSDSDRMFSNSSSTYAKVSAEITEADLSFTLIHSHWNYKEKTQIVHRPRPQASSQLLDYKLYCYRPQPGNKNYPPHNKRRTEIDYINGKSALAKEVGQQRAVMRMIMGPPEINGNGQKRRMTTNVILAYEDPYF